MYTELAGYMDRSKSSPACRNTMCGVPRLRRRELPVGAGASQNTAWTEAGPLLSYSGSLWPARLSLSRVRSTHPERRPPELPIEHATAFDLVIDGRTLAHVGLDVPPHVAAQVTQWVE
jgi:hypothetical protein